LAGEALAANGQEAGEAPGRWARLVSLGLASRALTAVAVLGPGLVAFGLARRALLPDVGLWDTAEYQTVLPLLGTLHPTGFPSYTVLGWLASIVFQPLGSPAFRMDLLSAVLLGVAAVGVAWLALLLTGRRSLAAIAGLGLAVTPIAWEIGTRADAHALHLAILPYLLLALVAWEQRRRAVDGPSLVDGAAVDGGAEHTGRLAVPDRRADRLLLVAAALFGLGLADHRLIALLAPGIAAYVLVVEPGVLRRRRFVASCLGLALLVTAAFYLELPLRAGPFPAPIVYGHPDSFTGFWYVVLGVQFGGTLLSSLTDPLQELAALATLAVDQLGILAAALPAAVVIVVASRPRYAILTVPALVLTCLFAAGYSDADIGRYYLGPALIAWTWLVVAAGWVLDTLATERGWGTPVAGTGTGVTTADATPLGATGVSGPGVGASGPGPRPEERTARRGLLATAVVVAVFAIAIVPAVPSRLAAVTADSEAASGRTWVDAALAKIRGDSVVVSWWSYSTPLWYAQLIDGRRPDIRVLDDRTLLDQGLGDVFSVIDANLGRHTVYAIRIDGSEIARMERRYDITVITLPDGPALMRIDGIKDPSA
jgi:Protein O-mannosyl-transferase TMEM260-like